MNPKIVKLPGFVVIGKSIITQPASPEIPALWNDFLTRQQSIPDREKMLLESGVSYGVMESSKEHLKYLAGEAVVATALTPSGFDRFEIPENQYAVFSARLDSISSMFGHIYGLWFPNSGYKRGAGPEFERYGIDFDPSNPASRLEILVPVTRR
jgi:AraC family transcriptional regulator